MAMRNFFNGLRGLKVKEVPDHVKPLMKVSNAKNAFERWLENYHAKRIQSHLSTMSALVEWLSPTSLPFPRSAAILSTSSTPRSTATRSIDPLRSLFSGS
ncbi:hypothetical protein V2J09_002946 [Rumex salicifolius]